MPGRRKQKPKQGVGGGRGSQSQCAAALKELSRTRRKSLNKQQEEEEYTTRRSVASSAWRFLPALPIEMQMSLAQLRPQPRPEFPLPNESFHLQVVSVLVAVSFFCSPLLLSLSSFMFLRFFWCISSKWQVKWQACRLLHAIFFFLSFPLHLWNFSNPLFACGFLCFPPIFFFPIPIFCYEKLTKFSLTLALILSATLSAAGRIALDPKSTLHTYN